jgi:hypothetical protein
MAGWEMGERAGGKMGGKMAGYLCSKLSRNVALLKAGTQHGLLLLLPRLPLAHNILVESINGLEQEK